MRTERMKDYLRRNKTFLAIAGFLVFGSGCAGAISTTGDQLAEDALKPITVPVEQGQKAHETLEEVQRMQEEGNAALEDIQ